MVQMTIHINYKEFGFDHINASIKSKIHNEFGFDHINASISIYLTVAYIDLI